MILTRQELTLLIAEELKFSQNALLEHDAVPRMGPNAETPEEEKFLPPQGYETAKVKLYHMAAQAHSLQDMLADGEQLSEEAEKRLEEASKILNTLFRSVSAEKRPGQGMMEE